MKKVFLFLVSIILGILFVTPQLFVRNLTPLDYEESLVYGQEPSLTTAFQNSLKEQGRLRPLYNLQRFLMYKIFSDNNLYYYLTSGALLGLAVFITALIAGATDFYLLLIIYLLFIVHPSTIDNFYRLGTAEPLFTVFLLAAVYFFRKGKYFLLTLSVLFLMLSKETSVFVVPLIIIYLYSSDIKKWAYANLLILVFYFTFLVNKLINIDHDRYLEVFIPTAFRLKMIIYDILKSDWTTLLLILLISYIYIFKNKLIIRFKSEEKYFRFLIYLLWFCFMPLLLKWGNYYVFPLWSVAAILIFTLLKRSRLSKNIIIPAILFIVIFFGTDTVNIGSNWYNRNISDSSLTRYLKDNKGDKEKSYYLVNSGLHNNIGAWDIFTEYGLLERKFYPTADASYQAYNLNGVEGVRILSELNLSNYLNNSKKSVLISNPCKIFDAKEFHTEKLCTYSNILKKEICGWCYTTATD